MSSSTSLAQLKKSMQSVFSLFPTKSTVATDSTLGLVSVDSVSIQVTSAGQISVAVATDSSLGGIKIGSSLDIDSGVYNVTGPKLVSVIDSNAVTNAINASSAPTVDPEDNSNNIANTAFVHTVVNEKIAAAEAMIFKGTIGTEGSGATVTSLPASPRVGWSYKAITDGTWGGHVCEIGDLIVCLTKATSSKEATWTVIQGNVDGAVVNNSALATEDAIVVFSGTNGRIIKDSTKTFSSYTSEVCSSVADAIIEAYNELNV